MSNRQAVSNKRMLVLSPGAGIRLASPCNGVCQLGTDGTCLGCGRSLDEIAIWGQLGQDEREKIMARLTVRAERPLDREPGFEETPLSVSG